MHKTKLFFRFSATLAVVLLLENEYFFGSNNFNVFYQGRRLSYNTAKSSFGLKCCMPLNLPKNDIVVTLHLNFVYVHRDWRLLQYMHVCNKRSNIESVVCSLSYVVWSFAFKRLYLSQASLKQEIQHRVSSLQFILRWLGPLQSKDTSYLQNPS